MAIKIKFDSAHNVELPTFILATRSGRKLGAIPVDNIVFKDTLASYSELILRVYKELDGKVYPLWDQLKDFKLVYCIEWDMWFEISVELDETNSLFKNVTAKSLGEAELSQINLYDIEINTELDISRDDYIPTVLYDFNEPDASLLTRILGKAPHYAIKHVDASIAKIQRTFTFDGISIYDAFQEISEELNCLFIIDSGTNDNGKIAREISVYDLESYCVDCGHRDEFLDKCPECGSTNILTGYGKDTSIFVSTDNLADNITYSTDVGSIKNCFRLVAGDDLMTATLVNCNPNGSGYLWYISNEVKEDMSEELRTRLNEYDAQYAYYQTEHVVNISGNLLTQYNNLVDKYSTYSSDLAKISANIIGYPALMNACYDTIDFNLFLNSGLMPDVSLEETTAAQQIAKLTRANLSPVAVSNLDSCSATTATSAVLSMAKVLVDPRYQVKSNDGTLSGTTWSGTFIVTNYSDEEDAATSSSISVTINDDYEEFVKQKLDKALKKSVEDSADIVAVFDMDLNTFAAELRKYCLSRLVSFHDACQACLDILIEQGIADKDAWDGEDPNLYNELYKPYYDKLGLLEDEITVRESEIAVIVGTYDSNGELVSDGLQTVIERERDEIQRILNFESFVGEDLWLEFAAYRREDTYQNDNYISDGLNNAELFENALTFIDVAKKEIFKSATLQHSISATLKNLLVMNEFAPLVDNFEVGNWIRVRVDKTIYRLRLIDYEINFNNLKNISITFSDVKDVSTGMSDIESILNQAVSISTSYGYVAKQAEQGKSGNDKLDNWVANGLDLTNMQIISGADNQNITWDNHGLLFREFDAVTNTYDDCQLKIINSTMAITDNSWETVKTAVGKYLYVDPVTGDVTTSYGVNAETLVGKFILGEYLGIYNSSGSMSFDEDGFVITDGSNKFRVDPSPDDGILFAISNSTTDILYVDQHGRIVIDSDNVLFANESNNLLISNDGLSISNGTNSFVVNPNEERLLRISNASGDVFYVDENGQLYVSGDGTALDVTNNATIKDLYSKITAVEDGGNVDYSSQIEQSAKEIKATVSRSTSKYDTTEYDISLYGYGTPDANGYSASNYNGQYYLDQETGHLYQSNGTSWTYIIQLELITDVLSTQITETAEGVESRVTQQINNVETQYSSLNQTVDENTSTIANVDGRVTEIRQDLNNISLGVSNGETSSKIVLTIGNEGAGQITVESPEITMNGVVTFTDLSTSNDKTIITADNIKTGSIVADIIKTGTLDADDIVLHGTFSVESSSGIFFGGKIGYMMGSESGVPTDGVALSDKNDSHYLIVTDAGVRMQADDTFLFVSNDAIGASRNIAVTSDRRAKNSISYDMKKYETFFSSLKPALFRYNYGDDSIHTGFIAQDVQDALVSSGLSEKDFAGLSFPKHDGDIYGLAYTSFVSLNTYMIQELMQRIDLLEQIVANHEMK